MSKDPHRLFVIGMPGTGKSHWSEQLASDLGFLFIDTDREISTREGKTIAEIIDQRGITEFRNLEKSFIQSIQQTDVVVACGGGAPCYYNTANLLISRGIVIHLTADRSDIFNHLKDLPRAGVTINTDEEFTNIMAQRQSFYNLADLTIHRSDSYLSLIQNCINIWAN